MLDPTTPESLRLVKLVRLLKSSNLLHRLEQPGAHFRGLLGFRDYRAYRVCRVKGLPFEGF